VKTILQFATGGALQLVALTILAHAQYAKRFGYEHVADQQKRSCWGVMWERYAAMQALSERLEPGTFVACLDADALIVADYDIEEGMPSHCYLAMAEHEDSGLFYPSVIFARTGKELEKFCREMEERGPHPAGVQDGGLTNALVGGNDVEIIPLNPRYNVHATKQKGATDVAIWGWHGVPDCVRLALMARAVQDLKGAGR